MRGKWTKAIHVFILLVIFCTIFHTSNLIWLTVLMNMHTSIFISTLISVIQANLCKHLPWNNDKGVSLFTASKFLRTCYAAVITINPEWRPLSETKCLFTLVTNEIRRSVKRKLNTYRQYWKTVVVLSSHPQEKIWIPSFFCTFHL